MNEFTIDDAIKKLINIIEEKTEFIDKNENMNFSFLYKVTDAKNLITF
jgi:mannose-6-phosphate isomerase class I